MVFRTGDLKISNFFCFNVFIGKRFMPFRLNIHDGFYNLRCITLSIFLFVKFYFINSSSISFCISYINKYLIFLSIHNYCFCIILPLLLNNTPVLPYRIATTSCIIKKSLHIIARYDNDFPQLFPGNLPLLS